MKRLVQLLFSLCCLCLPAALSAQERDDSKYLAGAVPEQEGKVVFTKEFSIPGMQQSEIYDRMYRWMDDRLKMNANNSRLIFFDAEKGQLVGLGDEWIVFSSTALSLDRTRILYQLNVTCQPEKCTLEVEKIRYVYREGKEKYTAEEWIVDKYALNKAKTKLVRGLAKWRRKTVDFVDGLGQGIAEALSTTASEPALAEATSATEETETPNSSVTVIVPKHRVRISEPPVVRGTTPVAKPEQPSTPAQSTTYQEVSPEQLPADAIQTGSGKLVIVIGEEPFNMTMMTANAGGSLGKVDGKPVVFSILSPDQPHEQIEKAEQYVVRFYPTGATEPSVVLECKQLPAPAALDGMPRTYIGEIVKATLKK